MRGNKGKKENKKILFAQLFIGFRLVVSEKMQNI